MLGQPLQVISFDVKPANVLLDRTGRHAKLADVGLAKVLEHSQTMTNMVRTSQQTGLESKDLLFIHQSRRQQPVHNPQNQYKAASPHWLNKLWA